MMIKMVIATRRITNNYNYNHKREKMRITKIKIMIKKIANSCNQKTGEGRDDQDCYQEDHDQGESLVVVARREKGGGFQKSRP